MAELKEMFVSSRKSSRSSSTEKKKKKNENIILRRKSQCNQDQIWFHSLFKSIDHRCYSLSSSSFSSIKSTPLIDFSFQIPSNASGSSRITLIVDRNETSLKNLHHLFHQLNISLRNNEVEHEMSSVGGLDAFTFVFDHSTIFSTIRKLKQYQLIRNDLFWFSFPRSTTKNDEFSSNDRSNSLFYLDSNLNPMEIKENDEEFEKQIVYLTEGIYVEMSFGSLVSLGSFHSFETIKKSFGIHRIWKMNFYSNHFDIDYEKSSSDSSSMEYRKRIKSDLIENFAVINTLNDGFLIYLHMKGNAIDYSNVDYSKTNSENFIRIVPADYRPICSTIRLLIKLDNNASSRHLNEDLNRIKWTFSQFSTFFLRNHIQINYGSIQTSPGLTLRPLTPTFSSFIKNYSWAILISLGYRFHQRVTSLFITRLSQIEDDEEFYYTCIHLWRRTKEYLFINLYEELIDYVSRQARLKVEERQTFSLKTSLDRPPKNYQYVPSVTVTPTSIVIKPLKLCKTNRILREKKFGGPFHFVLLEIREEDGGVLYPLDFRQIRWKLKTLLVEGFSLLPDRIYRYLHHSQSQLKEKQFWFYHHSTKINEENLSFDDAYLWMGNFHSERVVAKHASRIAQCFTSTEPTIQIPAEAVKYINDVQTEDGKYNFTDGCGRMSTILRDRIQAKLGLHYPFSVMQIRYGGCKGVLSVSPELNESDHQLVFRHSMRKFHSDHDILESCRISAPRKSVLEIVQ